MGIMSSLMIVAQKASVLSVLYVSMMFEVSSYRQEGVLIQLVFGSNSKACVVAARCPSQVDRCLQAAAHLLVNGTAELCAVVAEKQHQSTM